MLEQSSLRIKKWYPNSLIVLNHHDQNTADSTCSSYHLSSSIKSFVCGPGGSWSVVMGEEKPSTTASHPPARGCLGYSLLTMLTTCKRWGRRSRATPQHLFFTRGLLSCWQQSKQRLHCSCDMHCNAAWGSIANTVNAGGQIPFLNYAGSKTAGSDPKSPH